MVCYHDHFRRLSNTKLHLPAVAWPTKLHKSCIVTYDVYIMYMISVDAQTNSENVHVKLS